MSITLIYLLKALILPPISLLLLALAGLLFRKRQYGVLAIWLGLSVLLLSSLPVVVGLWAYSWEEYPPLQVADIQQFNPEALVVIGGGAGNSAAEYHQASTVNTRTLLRLRYAARLFSDTGLPVLVSGGRLSETECGSEAELMAGVLVNEFKIPVAWIEGESRNTSENAQFSYTLLNKSAIQRIVLVTQAYHMHRALNEFRKAGFTVLPAPTAFIGQESDFRLFDFVPSSTAWMNSYLLAYENLAMFWYRLRN